MKRFTDTEKWADPWYRKLPPKLKTFWGYISDRASNAGLWTPDFELASFCIGEPVTEGEVSPHVIPRITKLPLGWYLRGFIEFQYGTLNPDCRPHIPIIAAVKAAGIPYQYPIDTPKKGTDRTRQDKTLEGEGDTGKGFPLTVDDACRECALLPVPVPFVISTWNKADGRGGRDAKDVPIRRFQSHVMTEWKYEQERTAKARNGPQGEAGINGADKVVLGKEYERVIERMGVLNRSYGDHQDWRECDKKEFHRLKTRKHELQQKLGVKV